jgi:hypothetical protein
LSVVLFIVSPEKGVFQMLTVHPATGRNRIGFMRGHNALLTTGSAHLGECE